jgi:protein TonB
MSYSAVTLDWQAMQLPAARWWWLPSKWLAVVLVHVLVLWLVLNASAPSTDGMPPRPLEMRMLDAFIPPPVIEKPKPLPMVNAPVKTVTPVAPPPVMTTTNSAAPSSFVVAAQPPAPVVLPPITSPVATAPQPVVTAARFDADYLKNPAPDYPAMSRRMGEEGKVLLLVQVSAEGHPTDVTVKQSSGFPRLDSAALNAVRNWRFVPAKRGGEAMAASVVVPLSFRLDN